MRAIQGWIDRERESDTDRRDRLGCEHSGGHYAGRTIVNDVSRESARDSETERVSISLSGQSRCRMVRLRRGYRDTHCAASLNEPYERSGHWRAIKVHLGYGENEKCTENVHTRGGHNSGKYLEGAGSVDSDVTAVTCNDMF